MAVNSISPTQAKALLAKNTLNLATKLNGGKTLTPKEVEQLEEIAKGDVQTAKKYASSQVELAAALGVERRTVIRWLKKPGCPGAESNGTYNLYLWREWAKANELKLAIDDDEDLTAEKNRLTAKQILLQNQKLEFQLGVLKKEYVPAGEVEKWGAELGGEIRKTVISIHKIAASLSGLPTAEIEIRLRDLEDEILNKLHLLGTRIEEVQVPKEDGDE